MAYVEIKNDTLAAVIAFVLFFIIADVLSTVLVIRHFGTIVIANEINIFVHFNGINGLASMKVGVLMFVLGILVIYSRYQDPIGDVLIGLAVAGAICAVSNLYFLSYGYAPTIGHLGCCISIGARNKRRHLESYHGREI